METESIDPVASKCSIQASRGRFRGLGPMVLGVGPGDDTYGPETSANPWSEALALRLQILWDFLSEWLRFGF